MCFRSFKFGDIDNDCPRRISLSTVHRISHTMFKALFSRQAQQLSSTVSASQMGKRVVVASAVSVFAYSTVQQCRKDVLFYNKAN
ncbi:hypothetical protein INT43_002197 [Umbelopsis isabellina]|uniref:Uncharacterized protein n=1 Tax=Mortierella isabellina TaxID=91625 RepID=A0A8H7Q4G0_MORIS|nr:hypothetical protein INT43_002197 [Umbelopsis isabellina]